MTDAKTNNKNPRKVAITKLRSRLKNLVEQASPDLLVRWAVAYGVRVPKILLDLVPRKQ